MAKANQEMIESEPKDNLYIANLPAEVDEEMLRELFGDIKRCNILPAKGSTRAALVQFNTLDEAVQVRESFDGSVLEGSERPLMIRYNGKPGGGADAGYGKAGGKGWGKEGAGKAWGKAPAGPYGKSGERVAEKSNNLYVEGLPEGVDEEWIKGAFGEHGAVVVQCKVLPSKRDGLPWHAMVRFQTEDEAEQVRDQFNGATVEDCVLNIDYMYKRDPPVKGAAKAVGPPNWDAYYKGKDGMYGKGGKSQFPFGGKAAAMMAVYAQQKAAATYGKAYGKAPYGKAPGVQQTLLGKASGGGAFAGGKTAKAAPGKGAPGKAAAVAAAGRTPMHEVLKLVSVGKFLPGADLSNDDNCLFITGLPPDCEDIHLYRLLAPFGSIPQHGCSAMKGLDGFCKGVGFVNFIDINALQEALDCINGMQLPDGSVLTARLKRTGDELKKGKGEKGEKAEKGKGEKADKAKGEKAEKAGKFKGKGA